MIGENLKRLRIKNNLTQRQLAELVGVSCSFITFIEKGRKTPSLPLAHDIAVALHCTVDDLLREAE